MTKKAPFAKGKRICIFCQDASGSRTSGEHIWPAWATDLLPKREGKREYVINGNAFRDNKFSKLTEQQGSPSSFKDRVVCKKCNEVWMGKIEHDAKPVLKALVLGEGRTISKADNKVLAQWLFLKFCVKACCADMHCVSQPDRTIFMVENIIPRYFKSWVFFHSVDNWQDQNRWHSVRAEILPGIVRMDEPQNVNTLALGFANVLFFMSYSWNARFNPVFPKSFGIKLWPAPVDRIRMPVNTLVDEDDVDAVANYLPEHARVLDG
jgi:hypothetical protein